MNIVNRNKNKNQLKLLRTENLHFELSYRVDYLFINEKNRSIALTYLKSERLNAIFRSNYG